MQRVLITGAAGFLGSHLADRFLTEGYEVVGVDNFITGSEQNIANLQEREGFSFLNHDISTSLYVGEELDGVLHFASPASPVDYLELPLQTLEFAGGGFQVLPKGWEPLAENPLGNLEIALQLVGHQGDGRAASPLS